MPIRVKISALFLCLLVLSLTANSQNTTNNNFPYRIQLAPHLGINPDTTSIERPPALSAGKITGQFFGGVIFGGIGGIICGVAAGAIFQCTGPWCELGEFALGASVGYTVFSSLAVYQIGNTGGRTASFPTILVADIAGFGVGALLASELDNIGAPIFLFGLPITGAILAYNITRKYVEEPDFPDIEIDQNVALEMPAPTILKVSPFSEKQFVPAVSLINVRF